MKQFKGEGIEFISYGGINIYVRVKSLTDYQLEKILETKCLRFMETNEDQIEMRFYHESWNKEENKE